MTDRPARGRSRTWRSVRFLLVVFALVLVWRGATASRAWMARLSAFRVDADTVRIGPAPAWITAADLDRIRRDAGLTGRRFSFFDPRLAATFRDAYARSPWVERVVRVRPRRPNRVDVALLLRKPTAGVLLNGGDIHLVSGEGVRLPGVRKRPPEGLGRPLLLLSGVRATPPAAGEVWSDAVRHGAAVAEDLGALPVEVARKAGILSVDVGNVDCRVDPKAPEITLTTASGAVIEWGRSRISPRGSLEPPVADKFLRLRRVLEVHPGLAGLARVKLQFDDLVVEETAARVQVRR